MSVVGIGTDIVDIRRIDSMPEKARHRLALRILTEQEYQHYLAVKKPASHLAKRWAGKEAAAKALGSGIAKGVSFKHFEIITQDSGKPVLELTEKALELATQQGATSWHISLSDEVNYATAFVVLSR